MNFYFSLQFRMHNRRMKDFGLNPIIGYFFSIISYIGLSCLLFYMTKYAPYIYILITIGIISKLNSANRNDFLKVCFSTKKYFQLRMIENMILTFPFVLFLIYKSEYLCALILPILSELIALVNIDNKLNFTIPTPFFKYPFEFTVGFRNTFFVFAFVYFLTFMAIYVGNFNLGFFTILVVFITCMSFYSKPERAYYVWIFSLNPKSFLFRKIMIALLFSTILSLPILLSMSIFFPDKIWILLIFQGIGYIYLTTVILAKYADFPEEINFSQGVLFFLGLVFPPFILVIIPLFYSQSVYSLNKILK